MIKTEWRGYSGTFSQAAPPPEEPASVKPMTRAEAMAWIESMCGYYQNEFCCTGSEHDQAELELTEVLKWIKEEN